MQINIIPLPVRTTVILAFIFGVLASTSSRDVVAQANVRYIIEVSEAGEQCFYEVQKPDGERESADNQIVFTVAPGDKIQLKSINTKAVVEVSKNDTSVHAAQGSTTRGFAGGRDGNSFDVLAGESITQNVRANNGQGASRHTIFISCDTDDNFSSIKPSGPNSDEHVFHTLIPAKMLPYPSVTIPGPYLFEIRIPNLETIIPGPWRDEGGPGMEIDP